MHFDLPFIIIHIQNHEFQCQSFHYFQIIIGNKKQNASEICKKNYIYTKYVLAICSRIHFVARKRCTKGVMKKR